MKWERKTINEVCNVGDGAHASIKRTTEGFQYLTSKNFKLDGLDLNKVDFISEVDYFKHFRDDSKAITKPKSNDVLLSIIGSLGAPYLVKEEDVFGLSSSVSILRPKNEIIEPRFLFYWIKSNEFQSSINNIKSGVAQSFLSLGMIKSLPVIYPKELPTQRKIASILSAYDDLIENNLKRIKLLEEKAFASYKLIVQNEKLEEFTIEELANVVMGQSPTSDTYTNEKEDNLPFHQGVTNFSNYFVEHKIYCKAPIKIAEEGDILFSVRAPVGRINFTSDKICIGRGLCAFRSKKGFQNYFYHQLKEFFFAEDVIGNGAIFNAVTKVELMKVKLKTPSEKIQQEFEVEAEQMYNLILNLTNQNTKLREARDILLPKLMSRQIEV